MTSGCWDQRLNMTSHSTSKIPKRLISSVILFSYDNVKYQWNISVWFIWLCHTFKYSALCLCYKPILRFCVSSSIDIAIEAQLRHLIRSHVVLDSFPLCGILCGFSYSAKLTNALWMNLLSGNWVEFSLHTCTCMCEYARVHAFVIVISLLDNFCWFV